MLVGNMWQWVDVELRTSIVHLLTLCVYQPQYVFAPWPLAGLVSCLIDNWYKL